MCFTQFQAFILLLHAHCDGCLPAFYRWCCLHKQTHTDTSSSFPYFFPWSIFLPLSLSLLVSLLLFALLSLSIMITSRLCSITFILCIKVTSIYRRIAFRVCVEKFTSMCPYTKRNVPISEDIGTVVKNIWNCVDPIHFDSSAKRIQCACVVRVRIRAYVGEGERKRIQVFQFHTLHNFRKSSKTSVALDKIYDTHLHAHTRTLAHIPYHIFQYT